MEDSTNVETQGERSEQVDINKVMAELNALKSSNERLLAESKGWKEKYQFASNEKTSIEKQKLEKEGNFEQLLDQERKEKDDLSKRLRDREKSLLKTQARALLGEVAKDAHDVSDLLRLEEVSMLQYDEENLSVVKESVDKFVAAVREKKPWMFGEKKIPSQADGKPTQSTGQKSFGNMTAKEREQAMKDSFKSIF